MAEQHKEWRRPNDAAKILGRGPATVYRWMQKPTTETGIRTMKVERVLFVHMPSLLDYEATIQVGRPRNK